MSRNAAARRFAVGISAAIRWVREWRTTGVATAKPKGGDLLGACHPADGHAGPCPASPATGIGERAGAADHREFAGQFSAIAVVDRLVHTATRIELTGESLRRKRSPTPATLDRTNQSRQRGICTAEDQNRATSSRNTGRYEVGMVGDIAAESMATSSDTQRHFLDDKRRL